MAWESSVLQRQSCVLLCEPHRAVVTCFIRIFSTVSISLYTNKAVKIFFSLQYRVWFHSEFMLAQMALRSRILYIVWPDTFYN